MKLSSYDRLHLSYARSFHKTKILSIGRLARLVEPYWVAESAQVSFAEAVAKFENGDPRETIDEFCNKL